jgi:UPF0755 protein
MAVARFSNIIYKISGVAILLASFGGGWLVMDYKQFVATPLPLPEQGYRQIVAPGTSLRHFANELYQAGIVQHPLYLKWLASFEGKAQSIKAGEYIYEPGITPQQLLDKVVSGAVMQHTLTIVEGWTFAQLLSALRQQDVIEQTLAGLDQAQIMARLGHGDQQPEGRFLPDTYHFPRGTSDLAFLQRAYQAMETRLNEEWDQRDQGLPFHTPYEALIMASIIEKETALPEERPEIAGVFVRRLARGMRLQTDPTVIYGLGDRFDGNLRRRDLIADSPYNTYMHAGLPPTPIALPGLASLHAALHPAPGDALYFVSRGDGSHEFSATLEAHNKAVRRYQLGAQRSTTNNTAKQ